MTAIIKRPLYAYKSDMVLPLSIGGCHQWGQVVSPFCIEVRVGHSDVDELLDTPGFSVIFPVDREDLYTLHGDLAVWPPIKVQVL